MSAGGSMPFRVDATKSLSPGEREWMTWQMLEPGHSQICDGDEVGCCAEPARGAFGLLGGLRQVPIKPRSRAVAAAPRPRPG